MKQPTLFDMTESERRKEVGMDAAATAGMSVLALARKVAKDLCLEHGETNADEVGQVLWRDYRIKSLGPVAGSIFKDGFVFTGRRVKSARKKNHAREIKVWRLG